MHRGLTESVTVSIYRHECLAGKSAEGVKILNEHPEKREIKQAIINLSCGQTGNKKIESMEDTLEIINATLGGMVKGNELTVEQSAAVLTVAMKAYEVGKKARIKA